MILLDLADKLLPKLKSKVSLYLSRSTGRLRATLSDGTTWEGEDTARRGVANGYPSLNASARVPHAQLGSGGGGSTKFLREDNSWQTVADALDTDLPDTVLDASTTTYWWVRSDGATFTWGGNAGFAGSSGTATLTNSPTNTYHRVKVDITNANSLYVWRHATKQLRIGHNQSLRFRFDSATATGSHRIWIGFTGSIGTTSTPTDEGCGLQYDPSISANWQAWAYDGVTISRTDTGIAYAANKLYYGTVRTTSSGVYVAIAEMGSSLPAETSHTSNLPAAGTNLQAIFDVVRTAAGTTTFYFLGMSGSSVLPSS